MTSLLHERVTRSALARGDEPAVVARDTRLSYAELESLANRFAHALVDSGCRRGDRVALLLPKEPATVAAMLGTLKAGCAYVPIDLSSPPARAARIVASADVSLALVHASATPLLEDIMTELGVGAEFVVATTAAEPIERESFRTTFDAGVVSTLPDAQPSIVVRSDDAAHILFTSGSTGLPKGVLITHDNVASFLDWALPEFGLTSDDRLSSHPPLHFDLSTFDIYGALSAGAELHVVEPALNLNPHGLARYIGEAALTQWFSVPSTMTFLASADAVPDGGWPSLRRVLFCGEVLPTPILRHWMARLPHATFTNLYGPTEATIASSFHTFMEPPADDTALIPIGLPCAGEELLVLDEGRNVVPRDVVGDLYIAGEGLSPGYWRDEQRTDAAFVRDPLDPGRRLYRTGDLARRGDNGLFYFLGRVDSQIKTRGYRVELGEIETALNAFDAIRESAVVGCETDGFEGTQIGCAYALVEEARATPVQLRSQLVTTLPRYMLPTRWLEVDELPKNANGKIDRPRLRELLSDAASATTNTSGTA